MIMCKGEAFLDQDPEFCSGEKEKKDSSVMN